MWPQSLEAKSIELGHDELAALLGGLDLSRARRRRWYRVEGTVHGPARYSVRTRNGKLIWTPKPEVQGGEGKEYPVSVHAPYELYLPSDTAESNNVSEARPALRAELLGLLRKHNVIQAIERHVQMLCPGMVNQAATFSSPFTNSIPSIT